MTQGRLTPTLLALLFGLMLLGGCSFRSERVGLSSLTLDVAERANNDTPIAVDFVAIRDPALLKLLSGITASQWFSEREQYQRDYRQLFSVWSLELVPGQFRDVREFPFSGDKASGLLVFAGYNTPGAHRLRLNESGRVWLRFDSREMRLLTDQNR
ncbi:type VI secretion protein [Pseudomonas sp. HMWF032]|uniref:type VI secretion protein n=1 Tax=Pseudomonas sp. HMWF032 TaxID=2056866 RepID=UPI000D3B0BC3|nr:type VI secretion protein [Pseudomonas sp. HMWF032]PTT83791.1 type VI secretion protein [Pseudomonas sp. HMWF010]